MGFTKFMKSTRELSGVGREPRSKFSGTELATSLQNSNPDCMRFDLSSKSSIPDSAKLTGLLPAYGYKTKILAERC